MRVPFGFAVFILLVGTSAPTLAAAEDPCRYTSPDDPAIHLVLKSVTLTESGSFTAQFELLNREVRPAISLPVTRTGKDAFLDLPYASVEFKDLNGTWRPLASLPGDFRDTKDHVNIKPGETAKFSTFLMTNETANHSASDFRILIRLSNPSLCLVSAQFHATPLRQAVKSFVADPQ